MHFEVYHRTDQSRLWCWRLRDGGKRIVALGEGYHSRADCLHAIDLVRGTSSLTPVIDEPKD